MKNSDRLRKRLMLIVATASLACASLVLASSAPTTTSVNIVNNSSREILHVFSSQVNANDWSDNQLGDTTINAGQSYNLSVACDQQQVRVIGEDQDGCFLSTVVACGDSATWTITNDSARDCGY
jgi:hypothetical protein